MKFQGRGNTYVQKRKSDGTLGPAIKFCQDAFALALATESFEHINKCGAVDVPDFRGSKGSSGTLTLSYTDVEDKKFAIGVLGTVNAAAGSPSSVTNEEIPEAEDGAFYFLGGKSRHRAITSLVIEDSSTVPQTLTLDTHYSLDAVSGRIEFLDVESFTLPLVADYSHQDPAHVSMLTAAQEEYFVSFENINKANSNDPGSVELYRVRFDPASNIDFLSDELQVLELQGTVLADPDVDSSDTVLGQFGRRVL